MNPYYYIFYKLYKLAVLLKVRDSQFTAIGCLTLCISLNQFAVEEIFKVNNVLSIHQATFLFLFILSLNSVLFLWRKRYEKIKAKFDSETKTHRITGNIIVFGYVLVSFALPLIV